MISVNQLSVQFNGTYLFDDITFLVNDRDRIGLVGKNGAGKSTLLKILSGLMEPEKGNVAMPSAGTVGYLPQDMDFFVGRTVFEETASAFVEAKELEEKIEWYNRQLTERTDYESDEYMNIITRLNEANERYMMLGGYTMEADIEKVLLGLGFEKSEFNRQTDEFSGGWRMRIELAKILLQKPDVLLLDEPTNHLDIESIQWLEEFLKNYLGAVVMVSHDRAFLDHITNRTVEISLGKIYDYKASYSRYVELRKERREQQLATYKNQQKMIDDTEKFIERFRYKASKAVQVQSRIKQLDKVDRIEVEEEDNASIYFRFPPAPRSGKVVVRGEGLKKRYGSHVVFSGVDFDIERGERVAFVGKNGQGKTTLSKIIINAENHEGTLEIGHNVKIGYYAQNQADTMDGEKTVYETVFEVARGEMSGKVRNLLGSFLFSGEAVDKKVKVLSGGEKSRLAMCRLLLEPVNLLVLDEPTNHLDMRSKDVLKNALINYDGSLIVVSHDRDFLQGLTQSVYEFSGGEVKEHIGDVYEYLRAKRIDSLAELEKKSPETAKKKETNVVPEPGKDSKEAEKEIKKIQNQVSASEKEISRLEEEIKQIDDQLQDPEQYKSLMGNPETFTYYENLKKSLEKEMENWERLQTLLDEAR